MGAPNVSNVGSMVKVMGGGGSSAVAAGAGDATAVTGATIDRLGYSSAVLAISYRTTLTAAKTLAFAAEYQTSDDGTNWDTAVALQTSTVAKTGAATASDGIVEFDLNLNSLKRYIRFNFTPDLNNTASDTAVCTSVVVLGGSAVKPV